MSTQTNVSDYPPFLLKIISILKLYIRHTFWTITLINLNLKVLSPLLITNILILIKYPLPVQFFWASPSKQSFYNSFFYSTETMAYDWLNNYYKSNIIKHLLQQISLFLGHNSKWLRPKHKLNLAVSLYPKHQSLHEKKPHSINPQLYLIHLTPIIQCIIHKHTTPFSFLPFKN